MSNTSLAATLRPPTTPPTLAAAAADVFPNWILLESQVYFTQCNNNSTTATATTSRGDIVEVSFCINTPPAISYVCVHCPSLTPPPPSSTRMTTSSCCSCPWSRLQIFHGCSSSTRPDLATDLTRHRFTGFHPITHITFTLHLYSSASDKWTVKSVLLDASCNLDKIASEHHPTLPSKTIRGGSLIGWVDIWKGILTCDVLADQPVVRFIRLPNLMPGNEPSASPWHNRNVSCTDGVIKLVEMEHYWVPLHSTDQDSSNPPSQEEEDPDTIYLSDLEPPQEKDDELMILIILNIAMLVGGQSYGICRFLGIVGRRCAMRLLMKSWFLSPDPSHYEMLHGLRDGGAKNLVLRNLITFFPTLSIAGDNVVHLKSCARLDNNIAVLMSLNLQSKILETLSPQYLYSERKIHHPFTPCVLSKHFKISSPGNH
uniref:DUF1618 domain-containing protein n=1 Tax=Leersia perrieri TaxID=77586 RepID=A0A0D9VQB5_9ORYZ